jgi:hypothetical protein
MGLARGGNRTLKAERLHFLIYGEVANKLRVIYGHAKPSMRDLWETHRKTIMRDHIRRHPCTRPTGFWLFDAPEEYREVVSGCGSGEHGPTRPGSPYWMRIPCFEKIDPDNPPMVESETAFLLRHNVLTPTEVEYLSAHPKLLEPVVCEPFDTLYGHKWT